MLSVGIASECCTVINKRRWAERGERGRGVIEAIERDSICGAVGLRLNLGFYSEESCRVDHFSYRLSFFQR